MKNFFPVIVSLMMLGMLKTPLTMAQNFGCGTVVDNTPLRTTHTLPNESYVLSRTISITAHVVHDENGAPATTEAKIQADIEAANKFFEDMKLSFKLCSVNNVYNYNYYNLTNPSVDPIPEKELKTKFFEPKTINIYYVGDIVGGAAICGYANMPSSENDIIVLEGKCIGEGHTLAHEIGHYFGLYHTFQLTFGQELPDGSNCVLAGDLICDTPADKEAAFTTNAACEITASDQVNGVYYLPLTNNLMSYYPVNCVEKFTAGQFKRIAQFYYSHRAILF